MLGYSAIVKIKNKKFKSSLYYRRKLFLVSSMFRIHDHDDGRGPRPRVPRRGTVPAPLSAQFHTLLPVV